MSANTRTRLLQAAEAILVEQGVHALSVRHVGEVSGLNPTLITYHFGSIGKLLEELLEQNIAPMRRAWAAGLDRPNGQDDPVCRILQNWLVPLFAPAAFNPAGRALVVIDEIAAHGSADISQRILEEMTGIAQAVQGLLAPCLPQLLPEELRARLSMIAGAALGPPPRIRPAAVQSTAGPSLDDRATALLRFARAGLGLVPATCSGPQ